MMLNVFMAGPDRVRWELKALGAHGNGPYSLVIRHSSGVIVEYFDDVTKALMREGELEALLIAARATGPSDFSWGEIAQALEPTAH